MRVRIIGTTGFGRARRCLALVTLVLFGHAMAVDLLHGHAVAANDQSRSSAASVSKPHDAPAGETHSHDDCPGCQLQQGFAFLDAAPTVLWLGEAAPIGPELVASSAAQRIAEGTAPCRAPPAL